MAQPFFSRFMVLCQTAFQTPIVIVGLLECLLSLTDSNNLAYMGNSALDMGIVSMMAPHG